MPRSITLFGHPDQNPANDAQHQTNNTGYVDQAELFAFIDDLIHDDDDNVSLGSTLYSDDDDQVSLLSSLESVATTDVETDSESDMSIEHDTNYDPIMADPQMPPNSRHTPTR